MLFPLVFLRMALEDTKHPRARRMLLCVSCSTCKWFWSIYMHLCGRIALVLMSQDDQASPRPCLCELRVGGFLAPTGSPSGTGSPSPRTAETRVVSTASWTPPKSGRPSATTSSRLLSLTLGTPRSRSLTNWLVATLAPASRQTLPAALSRANPLLPSTPHLAHAARWWPKASSGRPHRQVRLDRGNGSARRR